MNEITTQASLSTTTLTWSNKAGKPLSAESETGKCFAPKGARIAGAQNNDLAALRNGQFTPFLRDVRGALTKGEFKTLVSLKYLVGEGEAARKSTATAMLTCVANLWETAPASGKKSALRVTMLAWLAEMAPKAELIERVDMA
jgi:hypothetical protein